MVELARIQDKTPGQPGITKVIWIKISHTAALPYRGGEREGMEGWEPKCMQEGAHSERAGWIGCGSWALCLSPGELLSRGCCLGGWAGSSVAGALPYGGVDLMAA